MGMRVSKAGGLMPVRPVGLSKFKKKDAMLTGKPIEYDRYQ
jgi:hypothetical protein